MEITSIICLICLYFYCRHLNRKQELAAWERDQKIRHAWDDVKVWGEPSPEYRNLSKEKRP